MMFAEDIISDAIMPVNFDDTVGRALSRMAEFKLKHIPLLKDSQLLGVLAEEDLLAVQNLDAPISSLSLHFINAFVFNNAHTYEVIRLLSQHNLTAVPVLDQHRNYLGLISINNIVNALAEQFAVSEPGGIIVLEINSRDNSLAHISQIVESDNAQILSSFVNSFTDSTRLNITIKVNKTELTALVASFERYNYTVLAVFNNTQHDDGSQERFDSLMNYLNV